MFGVGESFIYGTNGICELTGTREMTVGRETRPYYVLTPVFESGSTIYIPVGNEQAAAKMRRLLNAEEIHSLIAKMPGEDSLWIEDKNERKEYCKTALAVGDRISLVRLMKAVFQHKRELASLKKKLHVSDERFLKDAEKMLYDEFAYVLGIKRETVIPYIEARIEEGAAQNKASPK
jgi:CarD family transcriptional regulator